MPLKFEKGISTKAFAEVQNADETPVELTAVSMRQGILSKKSRRGKWQPRYFVLRQFEDKDVSRAQLVYFQTEEAANDEKVDVAACLEISTLDQVIREEATVTLKGAKGLSYVLRADDETVAKQWAEDFEDLIATFVSQRRESIDTTDTEVEAAPTPLSPSKDAASTVESVESVEEKVADEADVAVEVAPEVVTEKEDVAEETPVVLKPEIDPSEGSCCLFGKRRPAPVVNSQEEDVAVVEEVAKEE
jgi:hypothetical protein